MEPSQPEEYEVEAIRSKRFRNGKAFYLVHWKGFSSDEDTWQSAEDLTNCRLLLAEFEKSRAHDAKPKKHGKSKRKSPTLRTVDGEIVTGNIVGILSLGGNPRMFYYRCRLDTGRSYWFRTLDVMKIAPKLAREYQEAWCGQMLRTAH
jgi:hypothetical protein